MRAEIETSKGTLHVDLYDKEVPGTVANFVRLANDGFYNGLHFHRVIPEFVVQGGCPYSRQVGDPRAGMGGPGWTIKCETEAPLQRHDRGVMSMAHAGRNTGGSQFFICHNRQNTQHLDGVHTCFGRVEEQDWDIIDAIAQWDEIVSVKIYDDEQ